MVAPQIHDSAELNCQDNESYPTLVDGCFLNLTLFYQKTKPSLKVNGVKRAPENRLAVCDNMKPDRLQKNIFFWVRAVRRRGV